MTPGCRAADRVCRQHHFSAVFCLALFTNSANEAAGAHAVQCAAVDASETGLTIEHKLPADSSACCSLQ